jgi:TPR repeat protein
MKYFLFIIVLFTLFSCNYMQTDCRTLVDNRDEYRNCMAAQGDAAFQYELGVEAFEDENYDTAIKWLKRAAQPRASAEPNYIGQEQKQRRDLTFEEDAIPKLPGHRGAQRLLVRIYEEGIGVPVNPGEADRYRAMINPI